MLIVGLGNPGEQYRDTRHNIGRMIVTSLKRKRAQLPAFHLGQTYMNESGGAVAKLLKSDRPESLVVICDDLDLPLGMIRIRKGGSSGGHKGIQSIIEALATEGFWRVRVGINRPEVGEKTEEYVLAPFRSDEAELLKAVIDQVTHNLISSQGSDLREETLTVTI